MNKKTMNSLSVIVPLYNQALYVEECLNALNKIDILNVEVIIIDDYSRDTSVERVSTWIEKNIDTKLNVRFYKNESNLGICRTLNKGVKLSTHNIIYICAADDFPLSDVIDNKVRLLNESDYDAIISDVMIIDEKSKLVLNSGFKDYFHASPKALENSKFLAGEVITNWCIPGPCLLIKKDVYNEIGFYNESLIAEDRDFYLRLFRHAKVLFDSERIAAYRVHSSNISKSTAFRKNMNLEIRKINYSYASEWQGIYKLYLKSYGLSLISESKLSIFYSMLGSIVRKVLRVIFTLRVYFSHG